jgi:hypothetical protein
MDGEAHRARSPIVAAVSRVNLNSRAQIGALLETRGWVPERRTEKNGQPKIDDELLETIPTIYPEFAGLAEHYTLGRRLGQLSNGNKSWLKHVDADERIHGGIVHIGTPHSRAAHLNPNIAQVPNPKRGKPFATECRALFRHPGGWVFVACDQAGLQDRCFSHYLAEFDGGDYGRSYVSGADPHWATAIALELIPPGTERDKTSKLHTTLREGSKSFRYGFLSGMRGKRAAIIIASTIRAAQQVDPSYRGPSPNGAQALHRFETATPGLRQLRESLEAQAGRQAWVTGLDGRRVPTGAAYKSLNRLVTSAEAIICKKWLLDVHAELHTRFRYGWDGECVLAAWIHDELVCVCQPEIAEQVGAIMVRHAKAAGEYFGLKVPLDASAVIGCDWAGNPVDGAEIGDSVLAGRLGNGPSEITHQRPSYEVESPTTADLENDDSAPSQLHRVNMPPLSLARTVSDQNGAGAHQQEVGRISCPVHGGKDLNCAVYADGHGYCFSHCGHIPAEEMPDDFGAPREATQPSTNTLKLGLRLWENADTIRGTLAERYLVKTRKLDLTMLPDIDAVLRFNPRCPFDGNNYPCLLALFRDVETDEIAGIHRVALTANGEKIDRMMLGSWPQPRAIKLRAGDDRMMIGEGIETTIAGSAKRMPEGTLWALGSAHAIAQLPIIAGVTELTILVDHDENDVGPQSARACSMRWGNAGCTVILLTPRQIGADFNDLVEEASP